MITTTVKTLERKDRAVVLKGEVYFVGCTHPAEEECPPAFDLFDHEYGNAYFGESIIGLGELSDELTEIDPGWTVLPVTVSLPKKEDERTKEAPHTVIEWENLFRYPYVK